MAAATETRSAQLPGAPARVFFSYTGSYKWDGSTLSTIADAALKPDMMTGDMRFDSLSRLIVTLKTSLLGRAGGLTLVWERVD